MPTLGNSRGRDFVPRLGELLGLGVENFRNEAERDRIAQQRQDIDFESQLLADMIEDPDIDVTQGQGQRDFQASMLNLARLDPKLAQTMQAVINSGDENLRKRTADEVSKGTRRANFVNQGKDTAAKRERWRSVIDGMITNGENTEEAFNIASIADDDQFELRLLEMQEKGRALESIFVKPSVKAFDADEGLVDAQGNIIRKPTQGGALDLSKIPLDKFTGASVDIARKSGNAADLKLRPAFKKKLEREGSVKIGSNVITQETDPNTGNQVAVINTPTIDSKGNATNEKLFLGGPIVSRQFGETRGQQTTAKAEEAKQITRATKIEERIAAGESKTQARDFVNINAALDAADNMPELQQNLNLLGTILTGGTDAIKIKALRAAGLEGGDLAELTFNLRKNVLRQLKPTFGAAFTEREGNLLAEIEASEDKSTDGNIRLMQRAIETSERAINRGIRSAQRQGDKAALEDIKIALKPFQKLSNRPLKKIRSQSKATASEGAPEGATNTGKLTKSGQEIWVDPSGNLFVKE